MIENTLNRSKGSVKIDSLSTFKESRMKKLIFAFGLLSLSAYSYAAALSPMNKSQTQNALSDKTITTISAVTLDGKIISDSFTGYFGKDGKVAGKLANKPEDGPQTDAGTWKVKPNGMVCVTWEKWNDAKEKCVSFYKLSNSILLVNNNKGFESLILDDQIKTGNLM